MEQKEILSKQINLIPNSFNIKNYVTALTRTPLLTFMKNSFIVATFASITRVVSASMCAYGFAFFDFKFKKSLFALVILTVIIPSDLLIVQNFITISKLGLINTYLGIASIFLVSATNIFVIRQSFMSFPKEIKEASEIDGCSSIQFFFNILLPIQKPVLITVFISSFVNIWNQYVWPLLVTNKSELRTIQVGITMLKDRESSIFGPVMAGTIIAIIPTIIIFMIFQRKIIEGMTQGSIKG